MTRSDIDKLVLDHNEGKLPPEEAARGLLLCARQAFIWEETLNNVREALGQEATHYLVIADDVEVLRKALQAIFNECLRKGRAKEPVDDRVFELAADALEEIRGGPEDAA